MQAVADNVDHNSITLDGRNTFHGMGIIVAVMPKIKSTTAIPRLLDVPSADLVNTAKIESKSLLSRNRPTINFKQLPSLPSHDSTSIDYEWACTWLFNKTQPSWAEFMQNSEKRQSPRCILNDFHAHD